MYRKVISTILNNKKTKVFAIKPGRCQASAFRTLKMEDFKTAMDGIYSTSVKTETLDESPLAYKNIDDIIANIKPTAKILKWIKPIYNYKASNDVKKWKK